jgi:fructosamine-3-kinase
MPDPIAEALSKAIGIDVIAGSAVTVAGGSIHEALRYRTDDGSVFLKTGPASVASMFAAEAAGLNALVATQAIRVPGVLALGHMGERAFLCLEWLDLVAPTRDTAEKLGEQLAAVHRCQANEHGWAHDNFIGRTAQHNRRDRKWLSFFREQRLLPQLDLARINRADAHMLDRGRVLAELLDAFFATYEPSPSLLHGDLWGGNWGATRAGEPAIFDPAAYYGDRETDIAMTRLFGGFESAFYDAYDAAWPLDVGAKQRTTLYNLYHILNHFNLFGGGYLAQARSMIERLLAELGR